MMEATADRLAALRPPGPAPVRTPWGFYRYFRGISSDPIAFVTRRFSLYGDIYYAPLRGRHLYAIRAPELVEQVLVTQGTRFIKTETGITAAQMRHFLGEGLLNSNGDHWRRQRRLVNPALRRRAIGGYAETIVEHTRRWSEVHRDGARLDLSTEMMELTLRIVARALFDHDVHADTDTVARAMDVFRESIGSPAMMLPPWVPIPAVQRARRALAELDAIVYRLIDERARLSPAQLAERGDLLSALAGAVDDDGDGSMTRQQMRDEILTLFLAGHETTSHALTWAFYLLARHPEIEADLVEEIDAAVGEGEVVTLDDLQALPRCAQVLDETMRLYPPAPVVSRTASEDTELGGYPIPAGAEIIVWIWATHRDARWYPDPEAFRPSRFAADAPARPRGAYVPFGAGQRTCIGKHFALMEARLVLANILRHWHVELSDPNHVAHPRVAVTLSPRGGLPVTLRRRR